MASLSDWIKRILRKVTDKRQSRSKHGPRPDGTAPASTSEDRVPARLATTQQKPIQASDRRTAASTVARTTSSTLQIALQNQTNSSTVYAYITGLAINNNNALILMECDGNTPYYPPNPSSNGTTIPVDVSIPLGAPGNTVMATIPQIAGGRIWFSIGAKLQFFVNPGPGLVEPSVYNPSDPNINTNFGFCEFTFNASQIFVNISYVDFVGPPIALTLEDTSNNTQHVSGLPANGMQTIANNLKAQTNLDGQPWGSLIVNNSSGQLLRIFSPNSGILLNPSWFQNYWTAYVNSVYSMYSSSPLTVDTQASFGNVNGQTNSTSSFNFGAGGTFAKPSAADIFSNSSGPFATGSNAETNTIIPRLAAAFNRSTLLLSNNTPDGTTPSQYYTTSPTNHYARIVHAANLDGLGYAFPYDDVTPDGGEPQEGALFSSSPTLLTVAVGGNNAYA